MNKLSYTPIALVLILTMSASKCNDKTAEAAGGVDKHRDHLGQQVDPTDGERQYRDHARRYRNALVETQC